MNAKDRRFAVLIVIIHARKVVEVPLEFAVLEKMNKRVVADDAMRPTLPPLPGKSKPVQPYNCGQKTKLKLSQNDVP